MAQEPMKTLETVSAIGYEGVEAGYGASEAFFNKCAELSLEIISMHAGLDALQNDLDGVIAKCQEIGNEFVVLSWFEERHRRNAADWNRVAQTLARVGAKLRQNELKLLYHHHDFEFQRFDGQTALEILFDQTPEEDLGAELDTYWIKKGGEDPAQLINRYASRLPLLHIKDITPDGDFAEIGKGVLNWPGIFEAAEKAGVSVYIVEQDKCAGDPFDSIRVSLENLKKMGKI